MIYELTVTQFMKALTNLDSILDKGNEFAVAKKIDMDVLLHARLAPDQFNLLRQVQIACDTAKNGASRLTGKAAPKHEDNEKTLADLKARIKSTLSYLSEFSAADYADAANALITQPRWEGKTLTGQQYAVEHMIPNMYFHLTTAYSILRHNGVEVGKRDFLGPMPYKLP